MNEIVGVEFQENGDVYYFAINKIKPKKNITVIVETERGLQFGKVVTDILNKDDLKFDKELKNVLRISSKQDYRNHLRNLEEAKEALEKSKEISERLKLKMQMVDACYTFDRTQLMFRFVADARVDFRDLAKELASIYKTRIELRQIGIRDKAKEVGGVGICGRQMCCSRFLKFFDSVSIAMAKNQNISLNPNKINGVCGRLLCCLKYEDDEYTDCKSCLPNMGETVETEKGKGRVISVDVLNRKYVVNVEGYGELEVSGCNCEGNK
jgi:Uncharacterized homolog of PSP1